MLAKIQDLFLFRQQGGVSTPILEGIEFEVEAGTFDCIMGPSGSGKTSLLYLLAGLDEVSAGSVELRGENLATAGERRRTELRRQQVAFVFQYFHLLPNLTLQENIALPLWIRGQNAGWQALAKLWAERLGLGARLDALPHELSGGERQRASIARAMVGEQPLILADEPTGNLSQKAGAEVMDLLRQAVDDEGRAVLLVTHNPRDAARADRVQFLVDGRLAPEPVLRGPKLAVEDVHAALAQLEI
ncbi:MAG: ABC transporter ATP-binding protein [Planctomycetes bacterium]|nr:ABC transporter ATP-binding protein [Planctomycetota bacterium]HRV80437.1 ABC transporter ATP-binding protein [Planctomycetota bacterium]